MEVKPSGLKEPGKTGHHYARYSLVMNLDQDEGRALRVRTREEDIGG